MGKTSDKSRTEEQLIEELQKLRQQVAALQDSETKYRAWFNNIADPVLVFDQETKHFLDCNQAAIDRYGYTLDELRTMMPYQLHPPDELEVVEEHIEDKEEISPHHYTHITKDGESLQVEVHTSEIEYEGRSAWISVVRDITEREQLLAALEHRSAQLQTAAEVSRAVSSILKTDELLPQVVELVCQRFDLYYAGLFLVDQTGEWTGEPGKWAVLRAGTGEAGRTMMEQSHKLEIGGTSMIGWCLAHKHARIALDVGEEAVRFDNPLLPETRSELALPLRSRGQAIGALTIQSSQEAAFSEEDIAVLQTLADQLANAIENARLYDRAQREITERKVVEEALRVSEERFALAMRGANDGLWDWDMLGDSLYWSPRMKELIGYADDELDVDFDTFDSLLHPDDREHTGGAIEAHLKDRVPYEVEQRLRTKSGEYRWFRARGQAIWDEDGQPVRMTGSSTDITERKQAEEALRRAHEDLEQYTTNLERRAVQLQVAAEVARETTAILDIHELLDTTVQLISNRFGFYHAGVFLSDERGEYAILRAASSEGGHRMLERGHKLRIGKVGIVGYVAATGEPRIALDVGQDAHFFDNPDLPETRSEMGIPLKVRDSVIGVLDVQSVEQAAFTDEDVTALQTMADQLAVAIDNARLLERTETQLRELSALHGEYSAAAWAELTSPERQLGYVYDRVDVLPAEQTLAPALDVAPERGEAVVPAEPEATGAMLARPLEVHGQVIGVVGVSRMAAIRETDKAREWSPDEIAIVEAVSEQVAVALESARLFEEARIRAEELAMLNELSQALAARLDVEQVLDETYRGASRLVDTTNFYIALYDSDKDAVTFALDVTEGKVQKPHATRWTGKGLTEYIIHNQRPLLIQENLPEQMEELGIEHIGRNALSWLGVPMLIGDLVLGVMAVQSHTTPGLYDEHDQNLLTAIASQAAIALQNAYLFEETQRRATQLAAAAEVARDATAILDVDQLLDETVHLISEQFGFYHAGVFLLDEQEEYAVLQAASSEGGQRMLERGHKLPVGKLGIVGYVADTGEPRIALDVGEDARHFANPDLPDTRSEMGLSLKVREQVIGVLDVQSTLESAFSEEDVAVLQTMADQLATAIANARLFQDAVETAEQLKEMDRLKSQFLANMSHELRTPLNSIIGFSRVILKGIDGPLTDMQRTDLQAVYDSGQHLLKLINDILDISKVQAGRMELSFEDADLREIIEGAMTTAIALVKDKPVELQQSIAPNLPIIRADPRRIRQVIINLLGNAAKFTEEGFIRVEAAVALPRAGETPTEVIISVADSGFGIAEEKLQTIFEEFTQVDGSSTRRAGGTGLGLSISRHFVELHGGRIWVESTPDVGSTFYFVVPIAGPPEPSEEADEETEAAKTKQPPTADGRDQKLVLCVDDDEGVITIFRRYLSKQGYRIVGLSDGTAVVEKARQLKPFAITLDVMMPDKDGWQIIQELKGDPDTRHIPVIMCTIVSEKEHGLSLGASDYLVKPILEEDLMAALERLDRKEEHHRVLVVDDQPEDRELLRRMIESQDGYEVVEAAGGQEAITLVRQVQPNIIILDLMMPDVDGFAVLESIKADKTTRSIPIIVVTAKELTQEERDILNKGVEALLQKGLFDQHELLADVAAVLANLVGTDQGRIRNERANGTE